jgi:hypothetical protein
LSTLALEGSEAAATGGRRPGLLLRYADLALLALALPVFAVAGLPLTGYAVAAAAWLAQHAILAFAERASAAALGRGERNRALGIVGGSTLARVWLVTLAILLVGLLGEREDGLAAAVLTLALVTVHLGATAISKLFAPEGTLVRRSRAAPPLRRLP